MRKCTATKCRRNATSEGYCARHERHERLEDKETIRIKDLVRSNNLVVDSTEEYATSTWIYHELGFYGQFNRDGELIVRCKCISCCSVFTSAPMTPRTIDHCLYCCCIRCVCEARKIAGKYDNYVLDAYWDNPCQGQCDTCKHCALC